MNLFRQRKSRLKRMSKEAFDNLPSGVCFFDRHGVVTLCNRKMHQLVFALSGRDLQNLGELQDLISSAEERYIFLLEDGSAWRFSVEPIQTEDGDPYTQVTASDVTELYQKQEELKQKNLELEAVGKRLRRLSANVTALTREEEILNMKMRVHDDIGRSVIATRQLLQQRRPTEELDLSAWKNAIALLQREGEAPEHRDALAQLMEAAAGIGIRICLDGALPESPGAAYLLITAMRECATNAVRHGGGTELYVALTAEESFVKARITNNGAPPRSPVAEGGGLSSLRDRVEKAGGTMEVRCAPAFELTVSVSAAQEERP